MADQINKSCFHGLFFSNPEKNWFLEPTGNQFANNALWLKISRYFMQSLGDESLSCHWSSNWFSEKLTTCLGFKHDINNYLDCSAL